MDSARMDAMLRALTEDGGLIDTDPRCARLRLDVVRALAAGRPVSTEHVDRMIAGLGLRRDEADAILERTERDAGGAIVGIMGLSLNQHPHHFTINGRHLSTWCAWDTLFLPAVLGQTASVESESPLSRRTIRLTVSPTGVERADPPTTVISMVAFVPDAENHSIGLLWQTFCHHIHFFASRAEAEQWAAGRDDITILTLDEGYALGQALCARMLAGNRE